MSSKINDKADNNIFIYSDIATNKFICEKIKESKNSNNIFNTISENEPTFAKYCFFDVISENKLNLLADIKNKKLFLVTKINNFGSAFFGNSNISSPNNVILSPIDPLMIFINIFFYTTCQNKIENYRNKDFSEDFPQENFKDFSITDFTTVSLGDMLTNYYLKLQNNSKIKKDLTQFDQNKLFVDSFLKVYFSDNEQEIELIAEKSYSKNL